MTRSKTCGALYLVATPIGNLEDITLRALRVLKEADLIACEDTRQTQKLLHHYGIRNPLTSYHEHNEAKRAAELVAEIEHGRRVALVSDAGTPVLSDPGHRLVSLCLERRLAVIPVPGPAAFVAALAASGMAADEFLFVGFPPAKAGARRKTLARLAAEPRTLVFYEAPHRLAETLADAFELLGNRPATLARELTKVHEEVLRGTLGELAAQVREESRLRRGEITLLIGPPTPENRLRGAGPHTPDTASISLAERVEQIMRETGAHRKTALKQAARERGMTKREAYRRLLASREGKRAS